MLKTFSIKKNFKNLRRREHFENLILDFLQFLLVGCTLDDELVLLLLQFGLLLRGNDAEQLILESLWRDHEVEERHLDGYLGQVVWVAETSRDVEAEILRVLDGVISELQVLDTLRSVDEMI